MEMGVLPGANVQKKAIDPQGFGGIVEWRLGARWGPSRPCKWLVRAFAHIHVLPVPTTPEETAHVRAFVVD
jgi:hypothetical protein